MPVDEIIKNVHNMAHWRTRFEGRMPFWDEILVAEIERLRAELAKAPKTIDGVILQDGMYVWEEPRHRGSAEKTVMGMRVEIRPGDYKYLYSSKEAAEASQKGEVK